MARGEGFRATSASTDQLLSLAEKGWDQIYARLTQTRLNPVVGPRFCTSYVCRHFAQDQCARLGDEACKVFTFAGEKLKYGKFGHSINIVKTVVAENGANTNVFCLYDPQGSPANISKLDCWTPAGNGGDSGWNPPQPVLKRVCLRYPDYCGDQVLPTLVRIQSPDEAARDDALYEGGTWWENFKNNNGALMRTCERHNTDRDWESDQSPKTFKLPNLMPSCLSMVLKTCNKQSHKALACKGPSKFGGEQCMAVYCYNDSHYKMASWADLPLPDCTERARTDYCVAWLASIQVDHIDMDLLYSYHLCRSSGPRLGIQGFHCHTDTIKPEIWLDLPKVGH